MLFWRKPRQTRTVSLHDHWSSQVFLGEACGRNLTEQTTLRKIGVVLGLGPVYYWLVVIICFRIKPSLSFYCHRLQKSRKLSFCRSWNLGMFLFYYFKCDWIDVHLISRMIFLDFGGQRSLISQDAFREFLKFWHKHPPWPKNGHLGVKGWGLCGYKPAYGHTWIKLKPKIRVKLFCAEWRQTNTQYWSCKRVS